MNTPFKPGIEVINLQKTKKIRKWCSGCGAHGAMDPQEMIERMKECVPCSIDLENDGNYFNDHVIIIFDDAVKNHGIEKVKLAWEKFEFMEV